MLWSQVRLAQLQRRRQQGSSTVQFAQADKGVADAVLDECPRIGRQRSIAVDAGRPTIEQFESGQLLAGGFRNHRAVAAQSQCVGRFEDAGQTLRDYLKKFPKEPGAATAKKWLDRLVADGKIRNN